MKKMYTIDEVVAHAMTIIPNAEARDIRFMRTWVVMGWREARLESVTREFVQLTYDSSTKMWALPSDHQKTIRYRLTEKDDNEKIVPHKVTRSLSEYNSNDIVIPLQEDRSSVKTNLENEKDYDLYIEYFTYPTSVDGRNESQLVVDELLITPLVTYIEYMYNRRNGNNNPRLLQQFREEMRQAKARLKAPSNDELERVAREWMSMIPNFKQHRNSVK